MPIETGLSLSQRSTEGGRSRPLSAIRSIIVAVASLDTPHYDEGSRIDRAPAKCSIVLSRRPRQTLRSSFAGRNQMPKPPCLPKAYL